LNHFDIRFDCKDTFISKWDKTSNKVSLDPGDFIYKRREPDPGMSSSLRSYRMFVEWMRALAISQSVILWFMASRRRVMRFLLQPETA
jgi:hypothetical protein